MRGLLMTLELEQVYRMTYPMVHRRVSRFFSESEVESAAQDIFLKVAQSIHAFDGRSSVTTWIYQIATNYCLNRIRDEKRHRELLEQWSTDLYPTDIGGSSEDRIFLNQIWNLLESELMETGFYYYVDGMTQTEIAELMQVSERTVRNRLNRLADEGEKLQEQL